MQDHSFPASCPAMDPDQSGVVGGLSEARPATPEIQEVADKVRPQLEEKTNEKYEKFEAIEYKSQVVAGQNYFIKGSEFQFIGAGLSQKSCFTILAHRVLTRKKICSTMDIHMDIGCGCFLHIKVFRGIAKEDDWELDGYQANKTKNDELTYF